MTVPEQVPVTEQVANGVTVKFFVQFQYANKNDLHIYVDGVEPSISEVYFDDNAFNFYSAPQAGKIIKIQRITPKERDTDYDQSDNTFRPRVVNADFDKIWYVLQEVFVDIGGLSQAVQDEVIARIQGDEDLLNQLSAEISARILGDEAVTNDLKDYVNQVVGAILNDPTFNGIDASKVNTDSGETQQQVNDHGGATWYAKAGGYDLNDRVILDNGNEVKSIEPNNTINPNLDMAGWELYLTTIKYTEVANSIKRQLSEVIYDLTLDVQWFGAKADHNFMTGTGTVNDTAFQNCISFIGSLGSIRDGGKVKVKVPSGPYQLKHIDIPTFASMGFGLEFVGDGANSTALYFDETYTTKEAITCSMQGVRFSEMSLNGSLTSVGIATGRTVGIVAKLLTSDADIDIKFANCSVRAWNNFAEIWGRGFIFTGGDIGGVARFLTIKNETYNDSTPTKPNNIMRHYRIQNSRIDAASLLIKVEGTNTSQQINDMILTGNDYYALDKLIDFDSHTVSGLVCGGGSSLHSFATSMIRGTHLKNSVVSGLAALHRADASTIPAADGECIGKLIDLLGDAEGVSVTSNVIKNLRENIVHVRGNSKGVVVANNTLSECWSRSNTAVDRVLCLFDGSTRTGNIIKDNACTSSVFSGAFKQTNIPLANLGANIVKDNTSPWSWADAVQTAFLSVFAGGVDITSVIAVDSRICRFVFNGDYIEGVVRVSANTAETGAISATLPILAISDIPTATSAFGGCGSIANIVGFTAVGYVPAPLFVNAATDRFEFYKLKDMARTALNWSDGSGARTIDASFRYRYK